MIVVVLPLFCRAATTNVNVGQGGTNFVPAAVVIPLGDTIQWTWVGNNHSATSGSPVTGADGKFDSGIHNIGNRINQSVLVSPLWGAISVAPYICKGRRLGGAPSIGDHSRFFRTRPLEFRSQPRRRNLRRRGPEAKSRQMPPTPFSPANWWVYA